MIQISKPAKDGSSVTFACTLKDEDKTAVTPTAVAWTLGDEAGNIVNSRDDVSGTPGNPTTITLTANDLQYSDGPRRDLVVKMTYNSSYGIGLISNESIRFSIEDIFDVG